MVVKPSLMPISWRNPAKTFDIFKMKRVDSDQRSIDEKRKRRNFFPTAKEKKKANQNDDQPAAKR